jgi:hypothetical protein
LLNAASASLSLLGSELLRSRDGSRVAAVIAAMRRIVHGKRHLYVMILDAME